MIDNFKDQKDIQIIIFRLGNEDYAVPIMSVQEIIMRQIPTHIPKTPSWMEGVINLRGKIIPVIGREKFSLQSNSDNGVSSRIMVLDVEGKTFGLIVDEVSEVIHIKTEDIDSPPIELGNENDLLWGIGKYKEKLLILINPEKLLSNKEATDLSKIVDFAESKYAENTTAC